MTSFLKFSRVFEIETVEAVFGKGEPLSSAIDCGVGSVIRGFELFVRGFGIPVIEGEIEARTGKVLQEASLPEVRIAFEETDPVALGAIGGLKAFFATGLDFVLPEGYKHSCPISCSRYPVIQEHFKGKAGLPSDCSNPIGYKTQRDPLCSCVSTR
jgi:hypothetical protein